MNSVSARLSLAVLAVWAFTGGDCAAPGLTPPAPQPAPVACAVKKEQPVIEVGDKPARGPAGDEALKNDGGVHLKVVVREKGVRVLKDPGGAAGTGTTLSRMQLVFLFGREPAQEGAPRFYEVGLTPSRSSVIGWVPAAAVERWDTPIGLRYRRESVEGRVPTVSVYETKEDLLEALKGSSRVEPIARATLKAPRALNPWCEVQSATVDLGDGVPREVARIVFLGFCRDGARLESDELAQAPPPAGGASKEEAQQLLERARSLDIVFCLDATGSMGPFIQPVKETVRNVSVRLQNLDFKPDLRCGLVLYRDHTDSSFVTKNRDLMPVEEFLASLDGVAADEGGDQPEAVFDGVAEATEKTSWRGQGLSTRVICLVGDQPGHEPGEAGNPRKITRAWLVDQMKSRHIRNFALPVGNRDGDEFAKQKWSQFSELSESTGGACVLIENAGEVVNKLEDLLRGEITLVTGRTGTLKGMIDGKKASEAGADAGMSERQVSEWMEILKAHGVDTEKLAAGQAVFCGGWVALEDQGCEILRREVYTSREQLLITSTFLRLVVADLGQGRANFGSLLNSGLAPRIGEEGVKVVQDWFDGKFPGAADDLLRVLGMHVNRHSVLHFTLAELRHMTESRRSEIRERLLKKVVPALDQAYGDDGLWNKLDDGTEFGWCVEDIFP